MHGEARAPRTSFGQHLPEPWEVCAAFALALAFVVAAVLLIRAGRSTSRLKQTRSHPDLDTALHSLSLAWTGAAILAMALLAMAILTKGHSLVLFDITIEFRFGLRAL